MGIDNYFKILLWVIVAISRIDIIFSIDMKKKWLVQLNIPLVLQWNSR